MIPILMDHRSEAVMGFVLVVDGKLHVKFKDDMKITKEVLQATFGNIGFLALQYREVQGERFFSEIQIMEWSFNGFAITEGVKPND